MAEIELTIDLDDLTDVSRQDVCDFLSVHGDELREDDWVDFLDEPIREAVTLSYLREQPHSTITDLLDSADYETNVLDDMPTEILVENLIKRQLPLRHDQDLAFLRNAVMANLASTAKNYNAYVADMLEMRREKLDRNEKLRHIAKATS